MNMTATFVQISEQLKERKLHVMIYMALLKK